jgi:hypothetical protein
MFLSLVSLMCSEILVCVWQPVWHIYTLQYDQDSSKKLIFGFGLSALCEPEAGTNVINCFWIVLIPFSSLTWRFGQ